MKRPWYQWPFFLVGRLWDLACLCVLLAVVAAIPIVQLASLGYLLRAAGNMANGKPWSSALPGLRLAGKLGTFSIFAAITWLPVYVLTDLAYSAQLLQPGSPVAQSWRAGAFLMALIWVVYVAWAAIRGGRWWHFFWPAPIRFALSIWRPATWNSATDELYGLYQYLRFPSLWWLGARGAAGALLWTCVPVSLMIIGARAQEVPAAGLWGLVGAISMMVVMLYLPVLQVYMAATNRFRDIFNVSYARSKFKRAPWFYALAILFVCGSAIPLYLLRIEAVPRELVWLPSLVFVVFILPAKLLIGIALGYAERRPKNRHWVSRWLAVQIPIFSVVIYVGALYFAQFVAWEGAFVNYFQHAVLIPAPLISV